MHKKFDITLKNLLKDIPVKFLKIISGFTTGRFLDIQLTNINLQLPDLIIELPDETLLHIEIQSTAEKMLGRMYLYSAFIFSEYEKMPRQVLLYVGDKPLNIRNSVGNYAFEILDIREINCLELLTSDKPEDIVLAILCKSNDPDATISEIIRKLSLLPPNEREEHIKKLIYLSDLRGLYKKVNMEVKKMPITIDLENSEIFKDGVQKGLLEGQRKGLLEGERKGLLEGQRKGLLEGEKRGLVEGKRDGLIEGIDLGLELKFGIEGLALMDAVKKLSGVEKLEEFKNLIKKSDNIDLLKSFLSGN